MKTPVFILTIILSLTLTALADVQLYGPVTPPLVGGTYWSMYWGGSRPASPCIPLQFAISDVYGIVGWTNHFIYDDTSDPSHGASEMTLETEGGSGPEDGPTPLDVDYSTNLWVSLDSYDASEGTTYFFTIHNCQTGSVYELISCTNVAAPMNPTNWISEFVGLANSTNLSAYVPIGSKTNYNFFRAHLWTDFVYGVPTNGQIFIQSLTTNIYPVINGVTNHLTPFWSNWFVLNPRPTNLYAINLGYDASDGGMTNSIINTNPPQQVIRFAGFSKTITNLCISSNYISSLSVAGWPSLISVDAWHCISNLNVNVKNCPQLRRTCFEALQGDTHYGITNALDYTGCTNIAEIRAADNRFTDVVIDDASVSNVWHLCIHNNTVNQLPVYTSFSRYPALKELWIWTDYFQGPLIINRTNSPSLTSVQAFGNYFSAGDFHDQTNLYEVLLDNDGTLTNLNIAGCSNLVSVSCIDSGLTTSAVDDILTKLDSFGKSTCNNFSNLTCYLFNQSTNGYNQPPSSVGLAALASLRNKGWTAFAVPVSTTNTACIWFTNTSSSVSMKIRADTATSIKWVWGDGSLNSGVTTITKSLGGSYSNAVIVDPANALTGFGINCSSGTTLSGVGGLTNYPYLKELHFYQTGLNTLSLAGCANLVSIALVQTSPSTNVENAWFTDLAAAQPNAIPCGDPQLGCGNGLHHFYFPLNPGTNGIPDAVSNLVRIGWTLDGY
jgi:hypothetical protein